jgi:hypothetical protein
VTRLQPPAADPERTLLAWSLAVGANEPIGRPPRRLRRQRNANLLKASL